jgi:hypothetical protein
MIKENGWEKESWRSRLDSDTNRFLQIVLLVFIGFNWLIPVSRGRLVALWSKTEKTVIPETVKY